VLVVDCVRLVGVEVGFLNREGWELDDDPRGDKLEFLERSTCEF